MKLTLSDSNGHTIGLVVELNFCQRFDKVLIN